MEDIGAGLNGATAILGLKGALERGDMLSAVSSGLTISKMALTKYQGALSSQVAGMANNVAFIFEHVPVAERTVAQLEAIAERAKLDRTLLAANTAATQAVRPIVLDLGAHGIRVSDEATNSLVMSGATRPTALAG